MNWGEATITRKVVGLINYYAEKVNSLHKVKLMTILWYADVLNYKRHSHSITGLAYKALRMGAVPEGYAQIIDLEGISYEEIWYSNDRSGYKFKPVPGIGTDTLSRSELESIEKVIIELGNLNTDGIVDRMHQEEAYKKTNENCLISYCFAEKLTLD